MADKRAFFRMDVGYLHNPKILPLLDDHPRAVLLHLECIAYSAQHLTDGKVPMRAAMRSACSEQCDLEKLLQCGLLTQVDDTYVQVWDYLEHQRPASEAKRASDQARLAATERWAKKKTAAKGNAPSIASSNAERERKKELLAEPNPAADLLCSHLADAIHGNGSKARVTAKWKNDARLLLERDKRDPAEAHRLIDWCQANDFWRPHILSMAKFRQKYDTLRLQASKDKPKQSRGQQPEGW